MNYLPIIALVALCIGVPLMVAILYSEFSGMNRRAALEDAVDGRWNGRVRRGRYLLGERIEIRVDDVRGEITFKKGDVPWSRVWFNWPSTRRLRVTPEGFAHRIRRLFGAAELEFGDPPFDSRFWVEASDPKWTRGLLDPATRRDLVDVHLSESGPAPNEVMLDVGPSGLSLRVSWASLRNRQDMGKVVDLGISLLRKARGSVKPAGVVIEPVQGPTGSDCPVCGHPVSEAPHKCHSCHTAHHQECWSYFGGCAVFGCKSKAR